MYSAAILASLYISVLYPFLFSFKLILEEALVSEQHESKTVQIIYNQSNKYFLIID